MCRWSSLLVALFSLRYVTTQSDSVVQMKNIEFIYYGLLWILKVVIICLNLGANIARALVRQDPTVMPSCVIAEINATQMLSLVFLVSYKKRLASIKVVRIRGAFPVNAIRNLGP